jgi:hypothetical protein
MSVTLSLDRSDLRKLRRKLQAYGDEVRREVGFTIQAVALDVKDSARRNVPVDTSNLQSSIQQDFSRIRDLYAEVKTALEYAAMVEYGYTGTQNVGAHTRVITQAFGKPIDPRAVQVSAHTRTIDRAGTFYMKRAAAVHKRTYAKRIADAIKRAGP